jgi:outer membrane protein OmpA-like peptidoglycan-associated protein
VSFCRHLPLALVFSLAFAGCADLKPLQANYNQLKATMDDLDGRPGAVECAPEAMATARANREFAELEFKEGDARRAWEHVTIARKAADEALVAAQACKPKDTDGDGITDDKDACPREPEDIDGDRDTDGCPDAKVAPVVVKQTLPPAPTDRDADGVVDTDDQCPDAPEDLDGFKDADGCPDLDNDSDGILDTSDSCPMAAEDYDQFEDSDGCPDLDNDKDGIADVADRCPNDPEDLDGDADEDGCPDVNNDKDGDGVLDDKDRCPNESEIFNQYMDDDGCPDTKPQRVVVTSDQIVIKEQVQFQSGRAVILPASFGLLDEVVQVLKDRQSLRIRIEGHTDNQGADNVNLRLSKDRADAVFEYLLAKGIDARRLETMGFGETRPIDTNLTPQGRQINRRVEFHILDK